METFVILSADMRKTFLENKSSVPVQFSGNFYKVSEDISEKGQIKKVEG
jgi:hypothetical protein